MPLSAAPAIDYSPALQGTTFGQVVRFACLIGVGGALAYAAVDQGGQDLTGWNTSLLILGATALVFFVLSADAVQSRVVRWALLLPVGYVALQLVPLPLPLLRLISPARAALVDNLGRVMPMPGFAPISIDPATTVGYLVRTVAYCVTALLVCELVRGSWKDRSWAPVIPLIAIAGFEAVLGIVQSTQGDDVQGTYRSKDHFAGPLEMVLPLAVAYGISLLRRGDRYESLPVSTALKACLAFACAAAMLAGSVYSVSKMGFVAALGGLFAMGAAAVFVKLRGVWRWLAVGGVVVAVAAVWVLLPTQQLADAYVGFFSGHPAEMEGRAPVASDSRHLLSSYPAVGTGLGTFATAFLKYQTSDVDLDYTFAHDDYIELGSELGAIGFAVFGGLFLIALVKVICAARSEDWNTRMLGLGCIGALAAIAVHSVADFNLYIPANALLLAWVVGICFGISERSQESVRGMFLFRAVPAGFACLLVVYGAAWVTVETKYSNDPGAVNAFCRYAFCNTATVLAADGQENRPAAPKALPELMQRVRREPAAPHRWCDLGDGFLLDGQLKEARYSYAKALDLGPNIPPVVFRGVGFYHAVQDDGRALKLGAQLLRDSKVFESVVLDWYHDQRFEIADVLNRGLPPGSDAAGLYLGDWIDRGNALNAKTTWDWALSHRYTNLPIAQNYVKFLFGQGSYQEGAEAWVAFLGKRAQGYRTENWIYNGSFEGEPAGVPLDWQIAGQPNEVEAGFDSSVAHEGKRSLRIRFAGDQNVDYEQTSEKTAVAPGEYRFAAYIRTDAITTDKGVQFRVFDPEDASRLDVKSEDFLGTQDWTRVDEKIVVPRDTRVLEIAVIRQPTMKFDNHVSGTAWIDDVSLARID